MSDNIAQPDEKFKPGLKKYAARSQLRALDPMADSFTFQTYDDNKERSIISKARNRGFDPRAKTIVGTLDDCWAKLRAANEDGCAVHVTVNRTKGKRRLAKDVDLVRAQFVEIDGTKTLEEILALPFKPAWINESSPGKYHVYFNVAPDVASNLAGFTQRQLKLAVLYGAGRESKDLPRVLRLAGFLHQKDPSNPFLVRNVYSDKDAPAYSVADFEKVLGEIEVPASITGEREEEPAAPEDAAAIAIVTEFFKTDAPIAMSQTVNPETGVQGNDTTYRVMCRARDEGVEQSTCLNLALEFYNERCEPPWSLEELTALVASAYTSAQNTQGLKSAAADFAGDPGETDFPTMGKPDKIAAEVKTREKVRDNCGLIITEGKDIKNQTIDWMWEGYLARGNHTAFAGVQGDGKSQVIYSIAAQITNGLFWPGSTTERAPQGRVILLNAEDRKEDMLGPRLTAAGANMDFISIVDAARINGKDRKFNLLTDLDRLANAAIKRGNVKMITFDPVSSYFGGDVDSHNNTELRNALDPITKMAWDTDTAVASVTHFNKASKGVNALNRVMGGAGFTAAPRAAFAILRDAKDRLKRYLLPLKNNMSDEKVKYGMEFTLATKDIGEDERNNKRIVAPYVVWGEKTSMTADEALAASNERLKGPSKQEAAEAFLLRLLSSGPKLYKVVQAAAAKRDIADATLRRAREALGILVAKQRQRDGRGPWEWSLPAELMPKGDDAVTVGDPVELPDDEPDFDWPSATDDFEDERVTAADIDALM